MIKEIWKSVRNYDGIYEISNYGNIRRISKCGKIINRRMKIHKKDTGYLRISLTKNGQHKVFSVHRLVLEAFVCLCPKNMEGCHCDGDLENNFVGNLKWDTHQNNMQDSIKHGTFNYTCGRKGSKCNWAKLTEEQVLEIKKLISQGHTDLHIGKIFNVNQCTVRDIRLHKTWKHIGEIK